MKKRAAVLMFLAALGGAASQAQAGKFMSQAFNPPADAAHVGPRYYAESAGYVGPYGQPVTQMGYRPAGGTSDGAEYARSMLNRMYPSGLLQQTGYYNGGGVMPTAGGPGMAPPGMMPPGGPGFPQGPLVSPNLPVGAVAGVGMLTGQPSPYNSRRTEVRFVGPATMKISWYAPRADGKPGFTSQFLEAPARYNFLQSSIYRLKLSDIPNRSGVFLYPTLEVLPATAKTATFLAHSAVPISFTEEDFEQVAAGNFVVKVIYLPDPQFQDLAATGPDEVVSSRLEPGVDPIIEARRRGTILAVVRLGNIDLEAPDTPAMDAPDPNAPKFDPRMMMRPGMMPPGMMPPGMMPPGMMPPGPTGGKAPAPTGAPGTLPPLPGTPTSKAPSTASSILPAGLFGGR